MPADLIIDDHSVTVVDGSLIGHRKDRRWLWAGLRTDQARPEAAGAQLTVGGETASAEVEVRAGNAVSILSAERLYTKRVNVTEVFAREVRAGSVLAGRAVEVWGQDDLTEEPVAGTVEVKDAARTTTIRLDGARGDVVLGTTGSLLDTIAGLQAQIDELRQRLG